MCLRVDFGLRDFYEATALLLLVPGFRLLNIDDIAALAQVEFLEGLSRHGKSFSSSVHDIPVLQDRNTSTFSGVEAIREAYRHAIEKRYRFFSYGIRCC